MAVASAFSGVEGRGFRGCNARGKKNSERRGPSVSYLPSSIASDRAPHPHPSAPPAMLRRRGAAAGRLWPSSSRRLVARGARVSASASASASLARAPSLPSVGPLRLFSRSSPPPPPSSSSSSSSSSAAPDAFCSASMTAEERSVAALLAAELRPTSLVVQDVSGGCGTMFAIQVASRRFRDLSLLAQQRLVNAALGDRVRSWHGLQLRTSVPPGGDDDAAAPSEGAPARPGPR